MLRCTQVLQFLFSNQLPQSWLVALGDALEINPDGFSYGGSVSTSKMVSPILAPSIVLVGDAAHGITPRTGHGLKAALDSAIILVKCLNVAPNLRVALDNYNTERMPEVTGLVALDRMVR